MPVQHHLARCILCVIFSLKFISCDDCHRVRCEHPGAQVELRYLSNGQNAIFGDHALLTPDSVEFYRPDQPDVFTNIRFEAETMTIRVFMKESISYILRIGSLQTDTLFLSRSLMPFSRCCPVTIPLEIRRNGTIVCMEDCEEVIQIEL